jgi:uncharacterized phage infection (PIP) family protein YhgE
MNISTPLGSKTIAEYRERLTSLSSQKIELGLSQDLQKLAEQIDNETSALDKLRQDGQNLVSKITKERQETASELVFYIEGLQDGANDLNDKLEIANNLMKEAEKVSNDLGIREEDIPGYNDVENEASVADSAAGDAIETAKELRDFV